MNRADDYFAWLLKEYEKQKGQQQRELRSSPKGELKQTHRQGKTNYIQLITEDGKRIRKGITQDKDLIYALARKKYLQTSISVIENDIAALERCLKKHKAPTPDNILKTLQKTYNRLPIEAFIPEIAEAAKWAATEYEKNTTDMKRSYT